MRWRKIIIVWWISDTRAIEYFPAPNAIFSRYQFGRFLALLTLAEINKLSPSSGPAFRFILLTVDSFDFMPDKSSTGLFYNMSLFGRRNFHFGLELRQMSIVECGISLLPCSQRNLTFRHNRWLDFCFLSGRTTFHHRRETATRRPCSAVAPFPGHAQSSRRYRFVHDRRSGLARLPAHSRVWILGSKKPSINKLETINRN